MGKARPCRRKYKDPGPTGLASVKDFEREEHLMGIDSDSANVSDAAIQNIVDELQGSTEQKVFALHSMTSIFYTSQSVEDVVRQKVARIAGPLLMDPSSLVRNAAAGALRNLTASGNFEVCDLLVEQDIMTPVTAFFLTYGDVLPIKHDPELFDTYVQAVYLLCNLCEGNSTALQYFNDRNLLPVLMKFISAAPENIEVTLAIVQCFITVVEDNSHACNLLQTSEAILNNLLIIKGDSPVLLLLRVVTAGILLRVRSDQSDLLSPALLDAIVAPLLQDQRKQLNQLSNVERGKIEEETKSLREVAQLVEAQQMALELITNLCTDGDEEEMDLDSNSTCSDDETYERSLCEQESNLEDMNACASLSPEVHELIVGIELIPKIWEISHMPAANVGSLLLERSGGEQILKRVDVLRSRAFLCLNNIIPALDIEDLGGPKNLFEMWAETATFVLKNPEQDSDVLEAASSAMRAALQKFAEDAQGQVDQIDIQLQQIEFIFSAAPSTIPSVRANFVRTVSMLGSMTLSRPSEKNFEIIKCVGKYLLDRCIHEPEVGVLAETLDSIMDLFGEDETDKVAAELGLTVHLQSLLPIFKRKVKMNRKKLHDQYALVTTVKTNLPRFIHYKSKRLSALQTSLK